MVEDKESEEELTPERIDSEFYAREIDLCILAEKQTGDKMPHDGYSQHRREVRDWEKFLEDRRDAGLLGEREQTEEERQLLADFCSASAVLSGHGHPFFASTNVSVEQKVLVLNAVKSLANVMLLGDYNAEQIRQYYPATHQNHMSVLVQSFVQLEFLISSVAAASWDYFKSKWHFDQRLHGLRAARRRAKMFPSWAAFGFLSNVRDTVDELDRPGSWGDKVKAKVEQTGPKWPDAKDADAGGLQRTPK